MRDQHQHYWPDCFSVLIDGRRKDFSQLAGRAERHRSAVNVEGSQIAEPRRCLLNEGFADTAGKTFDDFQWQALSRPAVGSGLLGERHFPHTFVIRQQLPTVAQHIFDNFGICFAFSKSLQNEHPDGDACRVNRGRSGRCQQFQLFVRDDGSEHFDGRRQLRVREHAFLFSHDLTPDIKAAGPRFSRGRRKCPAKNRLSEIYFQSEYDWADVTPLAGLKIGILDGWIRWSCYPSRRKNRSIAWQ